MRLRMYTNIQVKIQRTHMDIPTTLPEGKYFTKCILQTSYKEILINCWRMQVLFVIPESA